MYPVMKQMKSPESGSISVILESDRSESLKRTKLLLSTVGDDL
jgi:hypothetical protein